MTIYFPIQPVSAFLTPKSQENFIRSVNRESNQHKIIGLLACTPEFINEMEHLEYRSHAAIKITPDRLNFFRDFSTVMAITVSFIVVGTYRYENIPQPDGSNNYEPFIPDLP